MKMHYWASLLLFISSISWAVDLTPERYIEIEIKVRYITLNQLKEKVIGQAATDTNYSRQIQSIYDQYNISAGGHLGYGNQHQTEIDQWLLAHPEQQARLDAVQLEFEQLITTVEGQ